MLDIIKTEKANNTLKSIYEDYHNYCAVHDFFVGSYFLTYTFSIPSAYDKKWLKDYLT